MVGPNAVQSCSWLKSMMLCDIYFSIKAERESFHQVLGEEAKRDHVMDAIPWPCGKTSW